MISCRRIRSVPVARLALSLIPASTVVLALFFMSTVYAVAPCPATLTAPLSPSSSSSSSSSNSPAYVNPAQVQNAQAGPSSQSSPSKKKTESTTSTKRKRTDIPQDSAAEGSQQPRKARDGPKKKKANRACFHCQKAHLTCDDCTFFGHKHQIRR